MTIPLAVDLAFVIFLSVTGASGCIGVMIVGLKHSVGIGKLDLGACLGGMAAGSLLGSVVAIWFGSSDLVRSLSFGFVVCGTAGVVPAIVLGLPVGMAVLGFLDIWKNRTGGSRRSTRNEPAQQV